MSRITDAQARQILNDYPQKNQYELASEYGVSQVAVSYTLNRRVDEKKKAAAERNKFSGK